MVWVLWLEYKQYEINMPALLWSGFIASILLLFCSIGVYIYNQSVWAILWGILGLVFILISGYKVWQNWVQEDSVL
jgi:O-antigen/teichoic acid export membrane protein